VVDASVAAKWFLTAPDEGLVAEAVGLLQSFAKAETQLLVPDLFFSEVTSLLWKAEHRGRCRKALAEAALDRILALGLEISPTTPLLKSAVRIARDCGCALYDGLYLALTAREKAPFITADQRLVRVVAGRLPVVWLGALL